MDIKILRRVKAVILNCVGGEITSESLENDFRLIGNILDSMSVTNLILGLEDQFGFVFDDEELSEETFETVGSLTEFVTKKVRS